VRAGGAASLSSKAHFGSLRPEICMVIVSVLPVADHFQLNGRLGEY